jgi:hypothetical protein
MRTLADTALGSAVGLTVIAAMFVTIWVARDSSARAGSVQVEQDRTLLNSARTHREPVTHTSIAPRRVRAPQGK